MILCVFNFESTILSLSGKSIFVQQIQQKSSFFLEKIQNLLILRLIQNKTHL